MDLLPTRASLASYIVRVKRDGPGLVFELVDLRSGEILCFTQLELLTRHLARLPTGLR